MLDSTATIYDTSKTNIESLVKSMMKQTVLTRSSDKSNAARRNIKKKNDNEHEAVSSIAEDRVDLAKKLDIFN